MRATRRFLTFLRRFKASSDGQALVEFALAIPIVLFLFLGVFEFSRLFFARLTLQHAVAEAARFAVTGSVLPDTLGNPMSRVRSLETVIVQNAENLDLDLDGITVDPADGGGPGDVVTVSANFTFQFVVPGWASLFKDGKVDFSVSTSMKNEPFLVSQGP